MTTIDEANSLLIRGVKEDNFELFSNGLEAGGDVNFMMPHEGDPTFPIGGPYPLIVYALERGKINEAIVDAILTRILDVCQPTIKGYTPIMAAASCAHESVFDRLLSMGADPMTLHFTLNANILYFAAKCNNTAFITRLVTEFHVDVHKLSSDGTTPLYRAAEAGHVDTVKCFAELGVDPHKARDNGWTALNNAADGGHVEVVRLLFEKYQCDPAAPSNTGITPLYSASANGHVDVVKYLVDVCGVEVDCQTASGWTPLNAAVRNGHFSVVQYFASATAKKADANIGLNDSHQLPWHSAAISGKLDVLQCLYESFFFDPNSLMNETQTALYWARKNNHTEIIEYLCDGLGEAILRVDVERVRSYFESAGDTASHKKPNLNSSTLIRRVSDAGAYALFSEPKPLSLAIETNHMELFDLIFAHKQAQFDFTDSEENSFEVETYFDCAVKAKNIHVLKCLMTAVADSVTTIAPSLLFSVVKSGSDAMFLYLTAECGQVVAVSEGHSADDWLIAAASGGSLGVFAQVHSAVCGDIKATSDSGDTLLHLACSAGSLELAMHLVSEHKLDISNCQNMDRETPLMRATRSGSLRLVQRIIELGADGDALICERSSSMPGGSLLHIAAKACHPELLAYFLSEECTAVFDIELEDTKGYTALHYAALHGESAKRLQCVRALLEAGAVVDHQKPVPDTTTGLGGHSALMLACYCGSADVVDLLLDKGADVNLQTGQGQTALFFAIPEKTVHIFPVDSYTPDQLGDRVRILKALLARPELRPNLRKNDTRWDRLPIHKCIEFNYSPLAALLFADSRVTVNERCCKNGYPLQFSIESRYTEMAKLLLLRSDLNSSQQNYNGDTPLVIATRMEETELCELIKAHPRFVGEDCIYEYVRTNKLAEVRAAVNSDPLVLERTLGNGETLFFIACSYGHLDMVKLIVELWRECIAGWVANKQYNVIAEKITARWHVSFGTAVQQVEMILEQVEHAFEAASYDGAESVASVLEQLSDAFEQVFPTRPEHFNFAKMQLQSLAYLSLIQADLAPEDVMETYHMHFAATLEMLYFNEPNKVAEFPLSQVCGNSNSADCVALVQYLCSLDSILVNLETSSGDAPVLLWVADRKELDIARVLLDCPRVDINKHSRRVGWDGLGILTRAMSASATEIAKLILTTRPEVDINYRSCDWQGAHSAMTYACEKGFTELVKLMLAFPSVEVNITDSLGRTPLMRAAANERVECLRLLVADTRIDVNMTIPWLTEKLPLEGCTALHFAAHGNTPECLELLYSRSDLIKEPRTAKEQLTPLMWAAQNGYHESVKWLVDHGADVALTNIQGLTARFVALLCGRIAIAKTILEREQQLSREANERRQQEISSKIVVIDQQRDQFLLQRQQSMTIAEHTTQISALQSTVADHTEQLKVLYSDREVLLEERLLLQQFAQSKAYLLGSPQLKAYYNHVQVKLNQIFLAYTTLASGAVAGAGTLTDAVVGKAIELVGETIPVVGGAAAFIADQVYGTLRDNYEDKIYQFVSSLFRDFSRLNELVESSARLTAFKLETQIERLSDKGEAEKLAECVVGYYLAGLRGREFDVEADRSVYEQMALCLLRHEPRSMFAYFTETTLKTASSHSLPVWTARGVIKESGIATRDGVCLVHPQSNTQCYGFRLGSADEGTELGYALCDVKVSVSHVLVDNPYRYREAVAKPKVPEILTWSAVCQTIKSDADMGETIKHLEAVSFDECVVRLEFSSSAVTREQVLQLAGCLSKQSKSVFDKSIGPILTCKAVKGANAITLTADNDISAELLASLLEKALVPPSAESPTVVISAAPTSAEATATTPTSSAKRLVAQNNRLLLSAPKVHPEPEAESGGGGTTSGPATSLTATKTTNTGGVVAVSKSGGGCSIS